MEQTQLLNEQIDSLLKYDSPVLVENLNSTKRIPPTGDIKEININTNFLDNFFTPKTFIKGSQKFAQHVSTIPSSRNDVLKLEEDLDNLLVTKRAQNKGICPVRSQIYEDCMNEIIRQVSIEMPERGELLLDIRDEFNKTIQSYERMYESSVSHGIRKAIHREQYKNELKKSNEQLEKEIENFETKIKELQNKIEETEKNEMIEAEEKEREHREKVNELKEENTNLRKKLEQLYTPDFAT